MSTYDDLELDYLRAMRDWLTVLRERRTMLMQLNIDIPDYLEAKVDAAYERYQQAAEALLGNDVEQVFGDK